MVELYPTRPRGWHRRRSRRGVAAQVFGCYDGEYPAVQENTVTYVEPERTLNAYTCPHCGVYAQSNVTMLHLTDQWGTNSARDARWSPGLSSRHRAGR